MYCGSSHICVCIEVPKELGTNPSVSDSWAGSSAQEGASLSGSHVTLDHTLKFPHCVVCAGMSKVLCESFKNK